MGSKILKRIRTKLVWNWLVLRIYVSIILSKLVRNIYPNVPFTPEGRNPDYAPEISDKLRKAAVAPLINPEDYSTILEIREFERQKRMIDLNKYISFERKN